MIQVIKGNLPVGINIDHIIAALAICNKGVKLPTITLNIAGKSFWQC